jgi:hypothetical protein
MKLVISNWREPTSLLVFAGPDFVRAVLRVSVPLW